MIYLKYLKKVLRHKWYTFLECRKLGVARLGIVHDWSKLRPSEFVPYARWFYGSEEVEPSTFDIACRYHQSRNKHHWQRWAQDEVVPIPDEYRREMLADWHGVKRACPDKDTALDFYLKHKDKMQLHPDTRAWIENQLIGNYKWTD